MNKNYQSPLRLEEVFSLAAVLRGKKPHFTTKVWDKGWNIWLTLACSLGYYITGFFLSISFKIYKSHFFEYHHNNCKGLNTITLDILSLLGISSAREMEKLSMLQLSAIPPPHHPLTFSHSP
jgi:hypothetical protein